MDFESPLAKAACWIVCTIVILGGLNYYLVANGNDAISKLSSKASVKKGLYYLIGTCTLIFLLFKILNYGSGTSHTLPVSFFY